MSHIIKERFQAPGRRRKTFFFFIMVAIIIALPADGQKGNTSGSPVADGVKTCNFWVGEIISTIMHEDEPNDHRTTNIKTTYTVRLREETPNGSKTEARLINDGSSVETIYEEEFSGNNGYGSTGSYHTSGIGRAKVTSPGSNFGSIGHLTINPKGKFLQYVFEMWPDKESTQFPVTRKYFRGDPPKENTDNTKVTFRSARSRGDTAGFATLTSFKGDNTMEGEYTIRDTRGMPQEHTVWKLHMETGPCLHGLDLDTISVKKDPCSSPASELALLNHALDQEKELLDLSARQSDEIKKLRQQAKQWESDFVQASKDCRNWDAAMVLVNYLVGNEEGSTMGQAGKELSNFLSFLDKFSSNDASWILPNMEFDKNLETGTGNNALSIEDIFEGLHAAYEKIAPESKPEALLDGLRKCGAPTSQGVMEGAVTYLRLLQQIEPLAEAAQKNLNDIRAKDQEVFDRWSKYHQHCIDYANCKGTDPKACDPPGQK